MNTAIDKHKIFNTFSLDFKSSKRAKEYFEASIKEIKQYNIILCITNFIFSLINFAVFFFLFLRVNNSLSDMNLSLRHLEVNETNFTNQRLAYSYYNKFILLNHTLLNEEPDVVKEAHYLMVRQYVFCIRAFPFFLLLLVVYGVFLVIAITTKLNKYQHYISVISYGIFGLNFHFLAGIIKCYFNTESDPIFFVVSIQLIFRLIIVTNLRMPWLGVMSITIFKIMTCWLIFVRMHHQSYSSILYYFSVDGMLLTSCVFLAFYQEYNKKNEFILAHKLNFDREYLQNLLYYIGQGFLSYSNKEIIFMNEQMRSIINQQQVLERKVSIDDDEYSQYEMKMKNEENMKFLKSHFSEGNTISAPKISLERLFDTLYEINYELPRAVHDYFITLKLRKMSRDSFDLPKDKKDFNLDDFFNVLKHMDNFKHFTFLGRIKLKNHPDENMVSVNKQYEIMVRVITYDQTEEFLEFMINDVSNIVKVERDKAVSSCRTLYLSKLAHEIKNPTTSLIELSNEIIEETNKDSYYSKSKIVYLSKYAISLCKIINRFVNNFSIFSNYKMPCKYCIRFTKCRTCFAKKKCKVCELCIPCQKEKATIFDYTHILKDTFETFDYLNKYENKKHSITFDFKTDGKMIKAIKDNFESILYNLLDFSYKSREGSHIKVCVSELENKNIQFEVSNNGLEINRIFINDLNLVRINFEENSDDSMEEINFDRFNKYFKLYISFSLAKAMGTNLKIESNKFGSVFSFEIDCNDNKKNGSDTSEFFESPMNISYASALRRVSSNSGGSILSRNTINMTQSFIVNYRKLSEYKIRGQSSDSSAGNDNSNNSIQMVNSNGFKILIIDDETLVRGTLIRYFKNFKKEKAPTNNKYFTIYEAENCFQALNIIYNKYKENFYFDFVVVDEHMPYMKGSTFIKLMTQLISENNFYTMVFISYTSFDSNEKKKFILDHGANFILNKPLPYDEFRAFMDKIISERNQIV